MPYKIVKRKGEKPWKIMITSTGKIVGSSTSKTKAKRSVGYREQAEKSKTEK